jgi:hypothetical protein
VGAGGIVVLAVSLIVFLSFSFSLLLLLLTPNFFGALKSGCLPLLLVVGTHIVLLRLFQLQVLL